MTSSGRNNIKVLSLIIFLIIAPYAYAVPAFDEVKASYKKSDAVLLDRHGKVIHELRVDSKGRRLDWISLKDVSPSLIKAVVHSEDRRFYDHHGVDWSAMGASAVKNLFPGARRGGSTITMQLVSILDKKLKPKKSKRTVSQKWKQMNAAKEMEEAWSKGEIIESYINLIFFRGELQGISAASRGLFGKEPSGLNESESLILASLIRSPNAGIEEVARRACKLGNSIESDIRCEEVKTLAQKTLIGAYAVKQKIALAPHAARYLLNKQPQLLAVYSTLDGDLQLFSSEALKYQLDSLKQKNVSDGAVLVVENKTGDILAYVASSGGQSSARHVDGIMAERQAGSTLKPFLYELALEKNLLTASSILNDSPLNITTPSGQYIPQDYDKDFKGLVSVRTALSGSLNIPAVRTLMLIGPDAYVNRLRQLGFDNLNDGDYYGLSLALGSADISLYELVNAYRALANNGWWSGLRLSRDVSSSRRREVMGKEAVFIISDILSDREARGITFGFENPLATRFWTAVKTGTSKDMRDNWCLGYSEKYTVGVWVGNFGGEPMWNVSGITGAAPIWLEIMNYLHRDAARDPRKSPEKVIAKKIKFQNNIESEREEWYIRGTEPEDDGAVIAFNISYYARPRIIYPVEGTIIALDPDIPADHQRIFFEMMPSEKGVDWILNNEKVGDSVAAVSWLPRQGRYILSLADNRNHIIDSIEFEVRGSDEGQIEYGMQ